MESMEDQQGVIRGLNVRLKGFLEHMDRLQETNMRLEGQIADWGLRKGAVLGDWSREENTVNGLRAQVRVTCCLKGSEISRPRIEPALYIILTKPQYV